MSCGWTRLTSFLKGVRLHRISTNLIDVQIWRFVFRLAIAFKTDPNSAKTRQRTRSQTSVLRKM